MKNVPAEKVGVFFFILLFGTPISGPPIGVLTKNVFFTCCSTTKKNIFFQFIKVCFYELPLLS